VVVDETRTSGAALLFVAFAVLVLITFRDAVSVAPALFFASLGVYASVRSSFIADRNRRVLVVKRRIMLWTFERVYEAMAIDRVYVRFTIRGSGLALGFKSGRSKDLTMSLSSASTLDEAAAALNHFLYTPHRG
jgi:predicted GNAT superfamily acetyltransferase